VMVAIIIGILSAVTQYLKYKSTPANYILKKIAAPTVIAAVITALVAVFYPITYSKEGPGFLIAIYLALFASIYAVVANSMYIWTGLNGKLKAAGASVAHLGFALMIAGMLISAGNKKIISEEKFKTIMLPTGIDPLTKQQDNAAENINLVRQLPTKMSDYEVTYLNDSVGHETGRRFYHLLFQRKDAESKEVKESFTLSPDVYIMKNNNMSSNPDTKNYLTHDVFTYVSYVLNPENKADTGSFKITEVAEGDTIFYSKGFMVYNKAIKNPETNKYNIKASGPSVVADLTITAKDSSQYRAAPMIFVDSIGIKQVDDTIYAQNLFVKFAGVNPELNKIKIGVKESESMIDFVTIKAYTFPYINLVWIGLIVMAIGLIMSMIKRAGFSRSLGAVTLTAISLALFYMFLLAN
jgi:cytochrome c-type biogenesis protein CcmF